MATAQLTLQLDEQILQNVTAMAVAKGMNVEAFLVQMLDALAVQPWMQNSIGPLTRQASGLIRDDGTPYRQQIEKAILERHGAGSE